MKRNTIIILVIALVVIASIAYYYFTKNPKIGGLPVVPAAGNAPKETLTPVEVSEKIADVQKDLSTPPASTATRDEINENAQMTFIQITTVGERADFANISNPITSKIDDPTDTLRDDVFADLAINYIDSRSKGKTHAESIEILKSYALKYN